MKRQILKTDFAALQILQYVHDLGSFSLAAEELGITQSTVSYAIAQLRETFRDPLFVRENNRTVATDRCRVIVGHAATLLETFEGLAADRTFDPGREEGRVSISCNHYERVTLLPALIGDLRRRAPGLRLRFVSSHARGEEQLKRGECDILLGPVQFVGETVFKRHVCSDTYVYVMDPRNPLAKGDLTGDRIAGARHAVVQFAGGWRPGYFGAFESLGIELQTAVELSEYGDLGAYLKGTDLIACTPRRLAERTMPGLTIRDLPIRIPLNVDMFWTTRTNTSDLFRWLRGRIVATVRETRREASDEAR